MARFPTLKVVVIGDLIVDEYINCQPLGMSQEDPTLVVAPIMGERFIGGAAIVAAHARGLGAEVAYFCVAGKDDTAAYAFERLRDYGVTTGHVHDDSRPTTLKQRFRANGKTLLRVSHLREHAITKRLCDRLFAQMKPALEAAHLVVFSDFNYGCLPQVLVERIVSTCQRSGTMMVADSQSSSQVGDVSRFRGMRLLTPTEREARLAVRDFSTGLVVLAESLRKQAQARDVFVTLGSEGVLVQTEGSGPDDIVTDRLPALNSQPKDVSGAGDSMLISASMALAVGADVWQSAYLGSLAAACQVTRVGNTPLSAAELSSELAA
jgi:rfaE bifunctional protein kinase chain/domain